MLLQRFALAGSLVAVLALPAVASADAPAGIIVQRVAGLDRGERLTVREEADVKLDETLPLPDTERVLPRAGQLDEALASLNANPDVVYAEPDLAVLPASTDPRFAQQWGLENTGQTIWTAGTVDADIDAPEAWLTTKGAGATVAVVDTGIELTHPDLAGQFSGNPGERGAGRETNGVDDDHNGYVDDWQGWDFVNHDNTIESEGNFHGTHVAGTIAALADNGVGGAGVAPQAKVLPVKIFGGLNSTASSSTIAQAFDYAGALGVDVVNASLGGIGSSQFVTDVIESHPGTLYVVAAGNNGADASTFFPCNSAAANLVCVGATDNRDVRCGPLELQRDRRRPVRARLLRPLEHPERRVHHSARDLDGEPARRGCRGAAGGRRAGSHDGGAEVSAADLRRRARRADRSGADRRPPERRRGADRARRRPGAEPDAHAQPIAGAAEPEPEPIADAKPRAPFPHAGRARPDTCSGPRHHARSAGTERAGPALAQGRGHGQQPPAGPRHVQPQRARGGHVRRALHRHPRLREHPGRPLVKAR